MAKPLPANKSFMNTPWPPSLHDIERGLHAGGSRRYSAREAFKTSGAGVAERKPFVAPGNDFVTLLPVISDPADVGHENPRFPRNVGADVPGIRDGKQSIAGEQIDMLNPRVFCIRTGLDGADATFAGIAQTIGNPIDVLF